MASASTPLGLGCATEELPESLCTILIVDDHPLVRKGMSTLLSTVEDVRIVGECGDLQQALQIVEEKQPQLVIVDISLKTGSGLELVKQVAGRYPQIRMLVCSMHDEQLYAERCLRAGASGYLNKEAAGDQMLLAVQTIRDGKTYLSAEMSDRLLNRVLAGGGAQSPIETLTNRELQVFSLIGRGLTTRQISEQLQLSYKTIESYRENIKAKLSLKNAAELNRHAVQWALENG